MYIPLDEFSFLNTSILRKVSLLTVYFIIQIYLLLLIVELYFGNHQDNLNTLETRMLYVIIERFMVPSVTLLSVIMALDGITTIK